MARIRTIKPSFFLSEELAALPYEWRLLFAGLWTQADREGRLEDRPLRLKAQLFPYDDLSIEIGLGCLANAGLIVRYEGEGRKLIMIPTWGKHQRPHSQEPQSTIPPPDNELPPVITSCGTHRNHFVRRTDPGELILENGSRRTDHGDASPLRVRFELFWDVFPRHVAKSAAWREWERLKPSAELTDAIIGAVQRYAQSPQWRKDGGQFVPHPRTFLHQKRWEDEVPVNGSEPRGIPWVCLHLESCSHQAMCRHKDAMPQKYPKREAS